MEPTLIIPIVVGVVALGLFFMIARRAVRWAVRLMLLGLLLLALLVGGVVWWWQGGAGESGQTDNRPASGRRAR